MQEENGGIERQRHAHSLFCRWHSRNMN